MGGHDELVFHTGSWHCQLDWQDTDNYAVDCQSAAATVNDHSKTSLAVQ